MSACRVAAATFAGCLAAGALAGCAAARGSAGAALPPSQTTSRDELLVATGQAVWRGDLARAHTTLLQLADRERGKPDTALDFWSELLALLRCEPPPRVLRPAPRLRDPWDHLRRLVQIERVRLARLDPAAAGAPAPAAGAGASLAGQVAWPVEAERWSDESPYASPPVRCAPLGEQAAASPRARASSTDLELVAEAAGALPSGHPAQPPLLLETAVLAIALGKPSEAVVFVDRLERLAPGAPGIGGPLLTSPERTQALLAAALAAEARGALPPEAVVGRLQAALAGDLPQASRRALQLRVAERLRAGGHIEQASLVLGPPPHGDDAVGRFIAFRQVEAHARAGRRAELLAEARQALQRKSRAAVERDPALAAVMDVAVRTLLGSPVSDETLEVLESLGPPRERLARAEMFAEAALAVGAHDSAMATFLWLRERDRDSNRQLQHLARATVAAARAGDRNGFARTFKMLAGQDEDSETMIASAEADRARKKRKAARSTSWERALLVVARDALASLVESGDQANLGTLVSTLQRHLGDAGRGPVDDELTTLYRAASAHLKAGARAYGETVGAARRPILLGDVLIGRNYDVPAPPVPLVPEEVGPMVFVPLVGNDPSVGGLRRVDAAWLRGSRPGSAAAGGGT